MFYFLVLQVLFNVFFFYCEVLYNFCIKFYSKRYNLYLNSNNFSSLQKGMKK